MAIVRRYSEGPRVEVIFGDGVCVFEPGRAYMFDISSSFKNGVENMLKLGEATHDLRFDDFDPDSFRQFAEQCMPERLVNARYEQRMIRQFEEAQRAILAIKVGTWTVEQIAAAAAHLLKQHGGMSQLRMGKTGIRLCFYRMASFRDKQLCSEKRALRRMQKAIKAIPLRPDLLEVGGRIPISLHSARDMLARSRIIDEFLEADEGVDVRQNKK